MPIMDVEMVADSRPAGAPPAHRVHVQYAPAGRMAFGGVPLE